MSGRRPASGRGAAQHQRAQVQALARRLLAEFQDHPDWQPTLKEAHRALGSQRTPQPAVREALDHLVRLGSLRRSGIHLALPATGAAPGPALRPDTVHRPAHGPSLEGTFVAHPDGFGFVDMPQGGASWFVPPREIGGALDGDWVRVEPLAGERGRARSAARVTAVLERRRQRARGRVRTRGGELWVVPLNPRIPDILIPRGAGTAPTSALVDVQMTEFPQAHDEYPRGRIVAQVPDEDTPEQIVDNLLANSVLPVGFSPQALAEARALAHAGVAGQAADSGARTDLTGTLLVTIDPVDARDFDDAVGLEALPNGHDRLWVAIADVAAYVRPGGALDAEAYQKGTSAYFPSRVLPMLPEELSNNLCSLRPGEPRLAMVVELELDGGARPVRTRFYQALIRSSARLNYAQVQAYLESGHGSGIAEPVRPMLTQMHRVARALRAKRAQRGAVEFEFAEVRFTLDAQGLPVGLTKAYPTEATRLVEQFMLEANEAVARQGAALGWPMLYRVHDPPQPEALEALALHLWNAGLRVEPGQLSEPAGVQAVLRDLEQHPRREQLELQILRAMSQARYRESNDGHFALAARDYTHFTSPIRRYPDVLVHRALKAWLATQRGEPASLAALPDQAGAHCSAAERAAADLEQQVNRLYRVLYLEPRLGEHFAATVSGLSDRGLSLSLRDEFIEGFLPMDTLQMQGFRYDRDRSVLLGRGHQRAGLGQRLTVQLVRADRWKQELEFALLRWGWEEPPAAQASGAPVPPETARPARRRATQGPQRPASVTRPSRGKERRKRERPAKRGR